jgi:hypothetical protein
VSGNEVDDLSELEALPPEPPDPSVRARLLANLHGRERWTPFAPEVARLFAMTAADARDALRRIEEPDAWEAGLWPGSQLLRTAALTAANAIISRLPAGLHIPTHQHATRELTYILDGEVVEGARDQVHGSGVLLDMARGTSHEVTVVGPSPCLVVFALRLG